MDWLALWVLLLGGGLGVADAAPPCAALEALDARRAVAFAVGSAELLEEVYAPGSAVLQSDTGVLRDYADRGLVVIGAQMEVLSCREVRRSGDHVELAVTDRLGHAAAIGRDGEAVALPRDRATKRTVTLVFIHGHWRIQ